MSIDLSSLLYGDTEPRELELGILFRRKVSQQQRTLSNCDWICLGAKIIQSLTHVSAPQTLHC